MAGEKTNNVIGFVELDKTFEAKETGITGAVH